MAEWLKAAVSKTVMGHWPIESSNLSLSAKLELVIDLLRELEVELTRQAPAVVRALRPGIEPKQIDALLSAVAQPIPEDLGALYQWHDGTETVHGAYRAELFTFGTMSPLARAVELWEAVVANTDGDWDPNWFPVFGEEYGYFHAVACGPNGGAVLTLSYLDLPAFHVEYPSLRAFVQSLLRRWRSRVYQLAGHAAVDADYRALAAIRRDEDGDDPDVAALVADLVHGQGSDWENASYMLGSRLYSAAIPALIGVLQDHAATGRTTAAELLGRIGGQTAADILRQTASSDGDEHIRRAAAVALRKLEADTDSAI